MPVSFNDKVAAFFSPNLAINSNGEKVVARSIFDSGDNGNPLVSEDVWNEYSDPGKILTSNFFDNPDFDVMASISNSSDGLLDSYTEPVSEKLFQDILTAAEEQNAASQSSADRAMEFNSDQARLNRAWQEEQNQKAMDFSERMSNTAIQRQMADLKAAGLNPKLAGSLGGASAPTGVTSSGSAATGSAANMQMAALSALSSVLSTYITGADALDRQQNDMAMRGLEAILGVIR